MLDKEIYEYKDFGYIKIKLDNIMQERKITTYELSNKGNIRFQTIQNLRKGTSNRISFELLSKICFMLDCKCEDIIEYIPKK